MDLRAYIYTEIDKVIQDYKDNIVHGQHTVDEYRTACGYVGGLEMAKDIIEETYRKYIGE